jgi:hypothetical protein
VSTTTRVPDVVFLGVDPGQHTGYAVLELYKGVFPEIGRTHPAVARCTLRLPQRGTLHDDQDNVVLRTRELLHDLTDEYVPSSTASGVRMPRMFVMIERFVFTLTTIMGGEDSHAAVETFGVYKALILTQFPHFQLDTRQLPTDAWHGVSRGLLHGIGVDDKGASQTDHAHMATRHALLGAMRIRDGSVPLSYDELRKWKNT